MRALLVLAFVGACTSSVDDTDLVDVRRADLAITVDVAGELVAIDSLDVRVPAGRELPSWLTVAWLAPDGSDVAAGERIVTFDDAETIRTLDSTRNELADATKRLERRREEIDLSRHERALSLRESEANVKKQAMVAGTPPELVASIEARTQLLDLELSRMSLVDSRRSQAVQHESEDSDLRWYANTRAEAQRSIELLEKSREQLILVAPRAGTIVYPTSGKKREVGDSIAQLDTVVQLVRLDRMSAVGKIDEIDLGSIAIGQSAAVHLDALPDTELGGTLESIGTDVVFGDVSKVIEVRIALAPTRAPLRPGMKFRGTIELSRAHEVLQVPLDAVFITRGAAMVYRATPHGLERTPVELGRRAGSMIEVVSGLLAGDRISRVAPETEGA